MEGWSLLWASGWLHSPKQRARPSGLLRSDLPIPTPGRADRYNAPAGASLQLAHFAAWPMTSEQAAQLIDDTLDLVHQRLQQLEAAQHKHDQRALAAEFREWRQPLGGHIDLMVCPGFPAV